MEQIPKSDIELASAWIKHAEQPCEDKDGNNLRTFYLREIKEILKSNIVKNPIAVKMLEDVLEKYKN